MLDDELATLLAGLTTGSPAVAVPCYYGVAPEEPARSAYPFVVVNRIASVVDSTIDGDIAYSSARYSFDIGHTARRTARSIADSLTALLQAHKGTLIKGSDFESDLDLYDVDTRTHHVIADFMLYF